MIRPPLEKTPYRDTQVATEKSQTDVRRLLGKYHVDDIQFTVRGHELLQMVFARPGQFGHMDVYRVQVVPLSNDEKGERQAARMMFWWMKAKLETIEFGLADFETEWMPYQLVSGEDGPRTVAEMVLPQLQAGGTNVDPFRPALPAPRP